ncbi:MAG: 3-hydroxyacyl-CoA dehydrogenase family protein [Bacteroidia bacterium]|nr:3-hydroxyacyl-CoA dehydrogenase family protein [Bacteroidia bacterium]MDW8334745.1 3-hydroxyacyl-CoA dehydrogenase family protein [Bacteroidia bacterium]
MRALIIADERRKNDILAGPVGKAEADVVEYDERWPDVSCYDFVVHTCLDETPNDLDALTEARFVFGSTVITAFGEFPRRKGFVGFNGLPYFIGLSAWEICTPDDDDFRRAQTLLQAIGITARRVNAGVGMVAPRILCMIINEAYRTAAEGTASIQDVETSMKLGVNYPYGPFEWAQKIGLENVTAVLSALAREYGPQYLPVPALKYARQGPSTVIGLG